MLEIEVNKNGADMRGLILTVLLFVNLPITSAFGTENSAAIMRCVGALNALEASIKKGQSPDWVRSALGQVAWGLNQSELADTDMRNHSGSMGDISYCESVGVSPKQINLFLLAYHGYLPADTFESLSACFAVFQIETPEIDQKLGVQRSQAFGLHVGKQFGEVATLLNYLLKSKKLVYEEVQTRAAKIQEGIAQLTASGKKTVVRQLKGKCGWYGISLEDELETIRITSP